MFCPACKAEYREGYTRCPECNVDLVGELPRVEEDSQPLPVLNGEPPALLWSGQDPVAFSVVISALDAAGIPYREFQSGDYTASLSHPMTLGFYGFHHLGVRVFARDLEAAQNEVRAALRPLSVVRTECEDEEPGENSVVQSVESTGQRRKTAAQAEIWSGSDSSLVRLFRSALLENFIPCWELASSNGDVRLFVSADDLSRARDIIQKAQAA